VMASIDMRRSWRGSWSVFSHAAVDVPERDPVRWAKRLVDAGAGEVLVTNVDADGTMRGYDLDCMRAFDGAVRVPLIACGGAGQADHFVNAARACKVSALAAGSCFTYYGPHRAVLLSYLTPEERRSVEHAARERR
jgi:cyclase